MTREDLPVDVEPIMEYFRSAGKMDAVRRSLDIENDEPIGWIERYRSFEDFALIPASIVSGTLRVRDERMGV